MHDLGWMSDACMGTRPCPQLMLYIGLFVRDLHRNCVCLMYCGLCNFASRSLASQQPMCVSLSIAAAAAYSTGDGRMGDRTQKKSCRAPEGLKKS